MGLEYYVQGEDGETYGPITLVEVAAWARENRVGVGTRVRAGQEGSWQAWEERPELVALLSTLNAQALFPDRPEITLAPIYLRAVAYLLDLFLVALPLGIAMTIFLQGVPGAAEMDPVQLWKSEITSSNTMLASTIELIGLGAQFLYFTYFHGRYGVTPGKKLLGLRVVNEAGQVPGYVPALLRMIGVTASGAFLYLGHFLAFISPNSRALHDFLAKTYVVRGRV